MTGVRVRGYVEETIVPAVRPGNTIVLDNLPVHKVSGIRERIEAAGARSLYLPAFSPHFDPIERVFVKLKAKVRAAVARMSPCRCSPTPTSPLCAARLDGLAFIARPRAGVGAHWSASALGPLSTCSRPPLQTSSTY
ncbi:putative transposase of insertion sequence [Methylorubrum populi]|uniref:Putative transposase of insertion sequence n=1 Tax=Methylorubrum populi TaxID=223967 RepID=A0A160PGV3_9HYPH|nr:putative transposase of insertion sequence [Methylorubrum populi]